MTVFVFDAALQATIDPLAQDSVVVESPLPGGVAEVIRAVLGAPSWMQVFVAALVVVGGGAAIAGLWVVRERWLGWIVTRSLVVKAGLAAVVAIAVIGTATAGTVSWQYMQHENDFCTGCHVMTDAYQRFTESEHDTLTCHDCHQQSVFASTRQLYLWVAERPEDIGEHAPVANAICERCHVTDQPERWQDIASTAGHRTHLESDSVALDEIMCVTCHGVEVHRFAPVDETCAQSDCHADIEIAIGEMASQTALHCATCHEFTAEIPATPGAVAEGTLTPRLMQCVSCHEMGEVLADFDPEVEPHDGACGTCHNAHDQTEAGDAANSCTTSGCHDNWRSEPFHVGTLHRTIGADPAACVTCHDFHRAEVDASDCMACHEKVIANPATTGPMRRRLIDAREGLPAPSR